MPAYLDRYVVGGRVSVSGTSGAGEEFSIGGWHSVTSDAYWSIQGGLDKTIGSQGLRVGLTGSYSRSRPTEETLVSLDYVGQSVSGRVQMDYPLVRSRSKNLRLGFALAIENLDSDILDDALFHDRIRYAEVAADYDFADVLGGVTLARLALLQGLNVFDATGNSRTTGDTKFTLMSLEGMRTQPFLKLGEGGISLRLAALGQMTVGGSGLFSAMECGYGGQRFGRAWEAGIMLGEHCLLVSAEIRWNGLTLNDAGLELYAFTDGGIVWQKGELQIDERRSRSAMAVGTGARLRIIKSLLQGFVEVSRGMKSPTGSDLDNDLRALTGLTLSY
jgi:hemolysin activation/secretion protein